MFRIMFTGLSIAIIIMGLFSYGFGFETLRAQLDAISQKAEDDGSLIDLPRSTAKPGLFKRAYEHAKSELYTPAVQGLDQVYSMVGDRCDYQDIHIDDISLVFGQTSFGSDLRKLSTAQTEKVVSSSEGKTFADACINIVRCYYADELRARDIERDQFDSYTTQTTQSCKNIVTGLFAASYQHTSTHKSMASKNYGEAIFYNGTLQDAPYDLMKDVEEIADALFRENTPVIATQVYNLPDGVWQSDLPPPDPAELEIDEFINPEEMERMERYAPSQGVPPELPEEIGGNYPYPNQPPPSQPELGADMCVPEGTYQGEQEQGGYEEEQLEHEQVQDYLDDLQLTDLELSVAIANRYTREMEENTADDDPSNDPSQPGASSPEYLPDLEGNELESVKAHIQGCIEQFTDYNQDSWRKTLWKSITQPTQFTQCVFQGLCKEVSDPTGLGIYHIKICKEPRKGGGVVGHQGVKSVEEIIDEMNTVCRSLQESGQLLQHNKTKDHMEHRMMNIKLGNIFSFGLSIVFDEPEQVKNYAERKRQQVQESTRLEKRLLGIDEKLTSVSQRNKYIITARPARTRQLKSYSNDERDVMLDNEKQLAEIQSLNEARELAQDAQMVGKTEMTQYFIQFISENIDFWRSSGDYTKSLRDTWNMGYTKFK